MAYLVKHPKSRFFFAVWRDANGRQIRRSTKAIERKTAVGIAREYEAASFKRRTARQVRQVIASLHRELTGENLIFPSVRDYIAGWLERKAPETAESTLAFYKKSTTKFLTYLEDAADKSIDQITVQHITGFRNAQAQNLAAKTANHDLKAIRMVFKAARKEGFVYENPAEDVEGVRTRGEGNARRPFTLPELQSIIAVADDEWRSMIQFGLYAGMRLADVACLTWANLDTERGELRYCARKTGKTLILPLAGPLAEHVATLKASDTDSPLHPRAFEAFQRTGRSALLSNWFANLLADAGLRKKNRDHRAKSEDSKGRDTERAKSTLSFHSLRHTAVSLLKDAGIPASVVMELVGHTSEQMSQHYTHVGREALAQAAEKMPKLIKS